MKYLLPITILFFNLTLSAQIDLVSNISDEDKLYGLSKFWSEATYNFAFFDQTDVNWDSAYQAFIPRVLATQNTFEYYRELKQFCALLKDGHTDVYTPNNLYVSGYFIRLIFTKIGDKIVIKNVAEIDAELVPIGSELISVDNQSPKAYFEEYVLPYISGSTEHERWNDALRSYTYPLRDTITTQEMIFKTPSGERVVYQNRLHDANTTFVRDWGEWNRFEFELIEGNIALVTINTFGDEGVIDDFKAALPEIKKASGVIIDLRGNGGGSSEIGGAILQYFTDQDLQGSVWSTREHQAAYKAWGTFLLEETFDDFDEWPDDEKDWYYKSISVAKGESFYHGDTMSFENEFETVQINTPLVVLISNYTASAAEDFLIFLDGLDNRGTVIGQRSFGSTGQPLMFELPGGGNARICTKRDSYPDGREFVGFGVEPDIFIEPTLEALMNDSDQELEAAKRILKK